MATVGPLIVRFDVWAAALKDPNAKSLTSAPYTAEYKTDLAAAFDKVTRDAATPTAALDAVQDRVTSYATK